MLISAWLTAVRNRLQGPCAVKRRIHKKPAASAAEGLEIRALLTTTLQAVRPNAGEFLTPGEIRTVAPQELTLQFSLGSTITPSTITSQAIQVFRSGNPNDVTAVFGDANDVPVTIGYVGSGSTPNEVVLRFGETLGDEHYRIVVNGTGANALAATVVTSTGTTADPVANATFDFELDLGARIVAVDPQPVTRVADGTLVQARNQIVVYFNDDRLNQNAAENPNFYQLINTNETVNTIDDSKVNPTSVVYNSTLNTATLTFAGGIAELYGAGSYRLRVGNAEAAPTAPTAVDQSVDPGSSFATAVQLPAINAATNSSTVISSGINPQLVAFQFPGADDEPGHREIEVENHLLGGADSGSSGIPFREYNFKSNYGSDPLGNPLSNAITEAQKDRAREIFAYYSEISGIDFVETASTGLTVVTGDMRALDPTIPTGPGGVAGLAGGGMAIMDMGETWANLPGQNWFNVAMHEIGHLLGQGHTYDLPEPTVQGAGSSGSSGTGVEATLAGDHDIVHLQYLYRPDSVDIDLYKFQTVATNVFSAEIMAERMANSGTLDSVLRLYREVNGQRELIAQNDNYFSKDSFLELTLEPGTYYIGVSSTGNDAYDPSVQNTGMGGTSQGVYDLRVNFRPNVFGPGSAIVDTTGRTFDGDSDGIQGGVYNFWFKAATAANTLFVDKANASFLRTAITASATSIGVERAAAFALNTTIRINNEQMRISAINLATNTLTVARAQNGTSASSHSIDSPIRKTTSNGAELTPFGFVNDALAVATPGQIVRIVGNGGVDNDPDTLQDSFPYEIGVNTAGQALWDGAALEAPRGVTVMIDKGAVVKLRKGWIGTGSSTTSVDRSGSAVQVLGTPTRQVIMTSWNDETIGNDTTSTPTVADEGDWGGIIFRNEIDRAQNRFNAENEGIFLNYVSNARLLWGGGTVTIDSTTQTINPIHMDRSQPTIVNNRIEFSDDSAMSADPDSFEELTFHSPRFQTGKPAFTVDYKRIGPDISGNTLLNNGNNALFVRMDTIAGGGTQKLTVPGRFNDTDIVHLVAQNLEIQGTPGGAVRETITPSVTLVTLTPLAGGTLVAGAYQYRVVFTDENGFESPASTATGLVTVAASGAVRLAQLPQVSANSVYTGRRIYRSQLGGGGTFTLIADLDRTATTYIDSGVTLQRTLVSPDGARDRARLDARLSIDPGIVVKLQGARIEAEMGAQLIAEGVAGRQVIFTSRLDDRYGAGGTFDTNNDDSAGAAERVPSPGNWGGFYFGQMGSGSIDRALITFAGGNVPVGGSFAAFNAVEIHESKVRIRNTTFERNADGASSGIRSGLFSNAPGTIFVRGAHPILLDNTFVGNSGAVININVNALNKNFVTDTGRSTGFADAQLSYGDNQGPLIRDNVLQGNGLNGMIVRGETLTTQSIWDDTDVVHIVQSEIYVPNLHTYGGIRLESSSNESLVVKLSGANAGFTAGGSTLDITDRIGGMLHLVGQPGQPVVLTSLADDTVGAGYDLQGLLQKDTNGNGASVGRAGDWRGVNIDRYSHDRNVAVYVENEIADRQSADTNSVAAESEFIGSLAENEKWGDENLRLGIDLQGFIDSPGDVDVYSFSGVAGSQVWIDIDRTTQGLDTVVELIDSNGVIQAQSDNYYNEKTGTVGGWPVFTSAAGDIQANGLDFSQYLSDDHYSINSLDAGFRVVLPGTAGVRSSYWIRVRSSNIDSATAAPRADLQSNSKVANGLTSGVYQMQIRLQEEDEFAGTTVQYSDIRFATNGIQITGQPIHGPLLGESEEVEGTTGQLGNLMDSDRAALAVRGNISSLYDADFYEFEVSYTHTQQIAGVSLATTHVPVVFDLDYADGLARADLNMAIFDSSGRLILFGIDSSIIDDQPGPLEGADTDDLTRGSVGTFDPFIGAVELAAGRYRLAVFNNRCVPAALEKYYQGSSNFPLLRVEPVNSIKRVFEERFTAGDNDTYTSAEEPTTNLFTVDGSGALDAKHAVPYHIGDVVLFVSQNGGLKGTDETTIRTINPFTGRTVTSLGSFGPSVGDIAMRPDGQLYSFTTGPQGTGESTAGVTGNYLQIDTGTAGATVIGDDGVTANLDNLGGTPPVGTPIDNNVTASNAGMIYQAMTYRGTGDSDLLAVGNRASVTEPGSTISEEDFTTNVLYQFSIRTGAVDGVGDDRINDARAFEGAGTTQREIGQITAPGIGSVTGMAFAGGTTYVVDNLGNLYTVNMGNAAATRVGLTTVGNQNFGFTSLVAAPAGVENGAYNNVLFAMTNTGRLVAFYRQTIGAQTAGQLAPVFFDGQSSVSTTLGGGTTGLAFSTLHRNLWATTTHRGDDAGHGVETRFDDSILSDRQPGGSSLYFGNQSGGVAAGNQNNLDATLQRNVNFPGGAKGSVISNAFSLQGYEVNDKPVLYFNYYLQTENAVSNPNTNAPILMRDSFRVFVADESGEWNLVSTNNSYRDANNIDEFGAGAVGETFDNQVDPNGAAQWRQARIDLSSVAGRSNLRLRFDVSTAGSMGIGSTFLTGSELRAITGTKLRDGQIFEIDGIKFEFEMGPTIVMPSGAVALGQSFTVGAETFNFAGAPSGPNTIVVLATDSSKDVAAKAAAVVNANPALGAAAALLATDISNRVVLPGRTVSSLSPFLLIQGSTGVTGANNPVVVSPAMTANQVALVIRQAIADEFSNGDLANVKGSEDLIWIIGHSVTVKGPLGLETALPGDSFGAFTTGFQDGVGNRPGSLRGMNNAVEGVYIDDIVLASAERGEILINAPVTSSFIAVPPPVGYTGIDLGAYDVEIRRTSDFATTVADSPPNRLDEAIDTNGRLGQLVSLTLPDSWCISNGSTITLSDGINQVIFEFDDVSSATRVAPGSFPIPYDSSYAETSGSLAGKLWNAINSPVVQSRLAIKSSPNNAAAFSGGAESNVLHLTGNAIVTVSAEIASSVIVTAFNAYGDQNHHRDQGQLIVRESSITDSSQFGLVADAAARGANADLPGPGSVRNLHTINDEGLVTGVVIMNNVIAANQGGGIRFSGDQAGGPAGPVPYGRIINNSIVGMGVGVGILVEQSASPTMLNNILADFNTGISVDASSQNAGTTIGYSLYRGNGTNSNAGLGVFSILLTSTDPLFVDQANRNYYPAPFSQAIDSSVTSLGDRDAILRVKAPMDLDGTDDKGSPIIAPEFDVYGQLRGNDPDVETPAGQGSSVMFDRGAIDRVDFFQPLARLSNPEDQSLLDGDSDVDEVWIDQSQILRQLRIRLIDEGIGIDNLTVNKNQFVLKRVENDGVTETVLIEGVDYQFVYNEVTREVSLNAATFFADENTEVRYIILVDNDGMGTGDTVNGIRDLAGNYLLPNKSDGTTRFDIVLTDGVNDPPENRVPGSQTTSEDTPLVFNAANGNAISIFDQDAHLGTNILSVTLTATNGKLTLGTIPATLAFSSGDGTSDITMVFTGKLQAINSALAGLRFVPVQDYFGPASVTIVTNDLGEFSGPPASTSTTIAIDVTRVNDPPVFNTLVNPAPVNEDAALVTLVGFMTGQVAGPANETPSQTLATQITVISENSSWTTATFFAVAPAINPLTGTLTFRTAPDVNGTATIRVVLTDNGTPSASSDPQTFVITVTPINDAPVFTVTTTDSRVNGSGNITTREDAGVQTINYVGASAAARATALEEIGTQTLTWSVSAATRTSGNLSFRQMNVNSITGVLTYNTTPDTAGSATVVLTLTDGGSGVAPNINRTTRVVTINVTPVNNAPVAVTGNYVVDESYGITLNATGSYDVDAFFGDTLTYAWDLDNNGTFETSTGGAPIQTYSWAYLSNLGITAPDASTIRLRVTDSSGAANNTGFANATLTTLIVDYGDAPNSYGTLRTNNGAAHTIRGNLNLGATIDKEITGQPSANATGDGSDEDGVTFPTSMESTAGQGLPAYVDVTASAAGKLDLWLDLNQNGVFDNATEHLGGVASYSLVAGVNRINFTIPAGTPVGDTFMRFRLSTAGSLLPTGRANDGEVEDYAVRIKALQTAVTPTITGPNAVTTDLIPRVAWTLHSENYYYNLVVKNSLNVTVFTRTATTFTFSDITPPLPAGTYTTTVTAFNKLGVAAPTGPVTGQFLIIPPIITSPSGSVTAVRPQIVWDAVNGAATYRVELFNLTDNVLLSTVNGITITNWTPTTNLLLADYRATVTAFNALGQTSTPGVRNFTVAPQAPVAQLPTGRLPDSTPTFSWSAVPGANRYELVVSQKWGTFDVVISQSNLTTTSFTQPTPLGLGRYTYRIRAINDPSNNSVSLPVFSNAAVVYEFVNVEPPTLTAPTLTTFSNFPTVTWVAPPNSETFDVYYRMDGDPNPKFLGVNGVTGNSYTPTKVFGIGTYVVWVRTYSNTDNPSTVGDEREPSAWSIGRTFRVSTPPTLVGPVGRTPVANPTLSWKSVPGALNYEIWINNDSVPVARLYNEAGINSLSYTVPANLPIGHYTFWVRARNSFGFDSNWSQAQKFEVVTAPVLTGPSSSTFITRPTFNWTNLKTTLATFPAGAARYEFRLYAPDPVSQKYVELPLYTVTNLTTNTYTIPTDLPSGFYRAHVRAIGNGRPAAGVADTTTDYSIPLEFFVGGRPVVNTIPPTTNTTPTLSWQAVNGASGYEVFIGTAAQPGTNLLNGANNKTGSTSFVTPVALAKGEYRYWIRAFNASTGAVSQWSLMQTLKIVDATTPAPDQSLPDATEFVWTVVPGLVPQSMVTESAISMVPAVVDGSQYLPLPEELATRETEVRVMRLDSAANAVPSVEGLAVAEQVDSVLSQWNEHAWWESKSVSENPAARELKATPAGFLGALFALAPRSLRRRKDE